MSSILLVDDDKDLLEMVSLVLIRKGYTVTSLTSGSTVPKKMEEVRPDLVLMDIYLGDSDGRTLCKELKLSKEFRLIPIILYSAGYIANSTIRESMADDFLVKPFDIKQLLSKIDTALKDVSSN